MKILIYSHAFAPSIGGVETIVMTLARGLTEEPVDEHGTRFDVTVVTQMPAGSSDDSLLPFRVIRRPGFFKLLALIQRADVVHLAGPALLPLALGLFLRKRIVVEHHGYQAVCPNGLLFFRPSRTACPGHFQARNYRECLRCNAHESSRAQSLRLLLLTFVRRAFCRRASANLGVTHHVEGRLALPHSAVIYHGIPAPPDSPLAACPRGNASVFAFVGRFVPEKGLAVLLDAVALLRKEGRELELLLIGDGPERAKLERQAERLSLGHCVRLTGFLSGDALRDALRDVCAVVMPSVWEETAGLAAIEQMMRGRLVIASAIGGLGEVVGDAGLTCLPGDPGPLADCLRRVLDDRRLTSEFDAKARERALHLFSLQRMIDEHAAVYRRLTSRMLG